MRSVERSGATCVRLAGIVFAAFFGQATKVSGQIYDWQTGQVIAGTQGISIASGPMLENWNTSGHELEYADFRNLNIRTSYFYACDLAYADFTGATLSTGAFFELSDLSNANFSNLNLAYVQLGEGDTLTGANFTGALINYAGLGGGSNGLSATQIYSTASYQNGDLSGVVLTGVDLSGWNFANLNLTQADFAAATLNNTDFTGATITGASFANVTTLTTIQLYSTASYQNGDLTRIDLQGDATGWNFAGQNLTDAKLGNVTGTDFTNANLSGATFQSGISSAILTNAVINGAGISGISAAQLYSTASYKSGDLSGTKLSETSFAGWNFSHENLTGCSLSSAHIGADFSYANLTNATFANGLNEVDFTGANFTGAIITGASIGGNLTLSQLYSTASYQSGDLSGTTVEAAGGNFAGMNLSNAHLDGTDANFTGANLSGATINGTNANFTNANLTGAQVDGPGANFTNANLTNAILGGDFTNAILTCATITGASLSTGNPFTESQFDSTSSYQNGNLSGISSEYGSFAGWNLSGKNLSGAYFYSTVLDGINLNNANLTGSGYGKYVSLVGANLSGANLTSAYFGIDAYTAGFTNLSNANLANANLTNTVFLNCNLSNTDFRGATFSNTGFSDCNLYRANFAGDYFDTATMFGGPPGYDGGDSSVTEADFSGAHIYLPSLVSVNTTDVNFAGVVFSGNGGPGFYFYDDDLRGATGWPSSGIVVQNSILPNGTIPGLALSAKELLVIRNNAMAIHVSPTATFNATSVLQFWLEGNWTSLMIFDLGVLPSFAGTLDLEFAPGVDPSTLIGETFQLFEFNDPLGSWDQFNSITSEPGLVWDTSNLYTNGTVTLMAVPEPAVEFLALGAIAMGARRRR